MGARGLFGPSTRVSGGGGQARTALWGSLSPEGPSCFQLVQVIHFRQPRGPPDRRGETKGPWTSPGVLVFTGTSFEAWNRVTRTP